MPALIGEALLLDSARRAPDCDADSRSDKRGMLPALLDAGAGQNGDLLQQHAHQSFQLGDRHPINVERRLHPQTEPEGN